VYKTEYQYQKNMNYISSIIPSEIQKFHMLDLI